MISFLRGRIFERGDGYVVVETHGVGYELSVSSFTQFSLDGKSDAELFVYMSVREDAVTLFGFCTKSEKEMFLRLISVSGIGPKLALGVLSGISAGELAAVIAAGDSGRLNVIKGVGKKTAERIVLELKDKLGASFDISVSMPQGTNITEAVAALTAMGFSRQEATSAVAAVKNSSGLSVEELVIQSLKSQN